MCRAKIWQAWNTAFRLIVMHAVPVGVGGVEESAAGVDARAVDQDVGPAGLRERGGQQLFDRLAAGDVDRRVAGLAAALSEFGHAGLASVLRSDRPRGLVRRH